jgi:hypothetical protein
VVYRRRFEKICGLERKVHFCEKHETKMQSFTSKNFYVFHQRCWREGGTEDEADPVFVNVYGAQESVPRNRFRQAGNRFSGSLKRFTNTGSGVSEEGGGSREVAFFMHQLVFQESKKPTFNQMKKLNNILDKKFGSIRGRPPFSISTGYIYIF